MSQPLQPNSSAQPEPTRTAPGEAQVLDKLPATVGHLATDPDVIRRMTKGEIRLTSDFSQWEEIGDGYATLCLVANEDGKLYSFTMPLLQALACSQQGQATYQNADPEARVKLLQNYADRSYAQEQMKREREREAVEREAAAAARARFEPIGVRAPELVEPAGERPGLVGRALRRLLGL